MGIFFLYKYDQRHVGISVYIRRGKYTYVEKKMNRNRTQEEIDMHDNCDMNTCLACTCVHDRQSIQDIVLELDHAIRHEITLVRFRGNNAG